MNYLSLQSPSCLVPCSKNHLTIFVGIMIICSRLFSFTWNLFIFLDVLFPLLYMIVPLVVLEVLVKMILNNMKHIICEL
jgi:hypothetical protein